MDQLAQFKRVVIDTDILIIGGGTAGCLAAVEAREKFPHLKVTILEKAHIDRSGCLAGGMNAINAYLNADETPESFAKFVRADSMGIIREDLGRGARSGAADSPTLRILGGGARRRGTQELPSGRRFRGASRGGDRRGGGVPNPPEVVGPV